MQFSIRETEYTRQQTRSDNASKNGSTKPWNRQFLFNGSAERYFLRRTISDLRHSHTLNASTIRYTAAKAINAVALLHSVPDRAARPGCTKFLASFASRAWLNTSYQQQRMPSLGTVTQGDGSQTDLYFRDMTNKIMHAGGFSWELGNVKDPVVTCLSNDGVRWKDAQIKLVMLMAYMGGLGF